MLTREQIEQRGREAHKASLDSLSMDNAKYHADFAAICKIALSGCAEGYVPVSQDVLDRIKSWSEAYPLSVFPEPDLVKARKLLEAGGMTLDSVSASNMRHVITKVNEMLTAAPDGGEG